MLSRLRDLVSNTDLLTVVAVAAVGWGISQLTKAVQDRQESIGALTNQAAVLTEEINRREKYLAELTEYQRKVSEEAESAKDKLESDFQD